MNKFVILLAVSLMVGCSSGSKKATTDAAAGPSTATTPATAAPTTTVETKKEDSKKSKAKSAEKTASDSKVASEVTCTSKQEVRKLAIKSKDQGCELEYTKGGQPTSVASQIAGQAKCEEVSTRIKEKLVAAGYTCE